MTSLIAAHDTDRVLPVGARSYTDGLLSSWWSVPRAVEVDGRTFAGGVSPLVIDGYGADDDPVAAWLSAIVDPTLLLDPGGLIAVVELGVPRRRVIRRTDGPDDHCTPAMLIEVDRPPILFGGPRASATIPYRRGTTPGDLSTMGPLEHIDVTTAGGDASYQQVFRPPGTDTITVLTRTTRRWWTVCRSTDWGDTWTVQRLIDYGPTTQGYLLATQDGDTLRCVAYGHPAHNLPEMRAFRIDLDTGDITAADGTPLGNLDGTGLPIAVEAIPPVWEPPAGHRTRLLDVSTTGEILLAVWPDGDDDNAQYRHLRHTDTWVETDLGPSGPPIGFGTGANYLGGAVFPNPTDGTVWLARNDGTGEWSSEWNRTGDTWTIEHWTRDGNTWTHDETVASDTVPLCRPVCPTGATTGPAVIWHRVEVYGHSAVWLGDSIDWHPRTNP